MARVDKIFQDNLALIMSQPWEEVKRPVYGDGTGVKVKRILQVCNQYDLRREFPLGSLRPTNLKNSIKEILAIYQKRSTNIKDVGNIWIPWSYLKTSNNIVKVKPVIKERYSDLSDLIEPLIEGDFEIGHSNNDGDFHIIEKRSSNDVYIQFIKTGYKTTTTMNLIKKGEIKDRYKRSVAGIGYLGNSYSRDIVDFFGEYHRRWISIWTGLFHRCYDDTDYFKTTLYYKEKEVFVGEDFHCCENFLRWVMKNLRYDKSYLGMLNIDKDYYASNCYSSDTCTLLTPSENKCLSNDKWFICDDRCFYSKKDLGIYLREKGCKRVLKSDKSGIRANFNIINPLIEELISEGFIDIINPSDLDDCGFLNRFDLNPARVIDGCYGSMIDRPVLLDRDDFNESDYYDEQYDAYGFSNQTDFILWSLKNDRSSRRILASMFDPLTNNIKPLQECAFQINLSVKGDELYMTLYQRSQDAIVAGLWNVAQYAALMMMFAHDAGLRPAIFTHFIQDMHVYDRHEEQANELLRRSLFGPVPQVTISSRMEGKGFYDFVADDFEVWNYEPKEQIKFEVAK